MSEEGTLTCPSCSEGMPDEFRFCGYCGMALRASEGERASHRTITVLFCDLKGSTTLGESLDSESLREVIAQYFERVRGVIERNGGEIEKFIGDAVMAVFGFPRQREDDALRAVRCAAEMKQALADLNHDLARTRGITLTNRTGVNTGAIVAGDPTRGERLIGDAVNVAARLEQAAPPNDILIGPETYRLVRGSVQVEAIPPLDLKGKAEPVPAYRLESTGAGTLGEEEQAPLVGRGAELEELRAALDASIAESKCKVVSVLGDAGVGKTRLVSEFGERLNEAARIVEGRCLSYGRGITFWPLIEIVGQAAQITESDSPEAAREKLHALAGGDALVTERVAAVIGLGDSQLPVEETFWGVRTLLEGMAAERPLVVVIQDLHWAEPTLLDLVEHLSQSAEAPILLLCPARPDLTSVHPDFEERAGAHRIALEPLSGSDVEALVDELLGGRLNDDVLTKIGEAAGGNPLFVEQFVSMMVDDGLLRLEQGRWTATRDLDEIAVPPTLQALLGARLDHLQPEELAVLEPASVMGVIFPKQGLEEMVDPETRSQIDLRISSLTIKELIHEETAHAIAGESYGFAHVQIKEATYRRLLRRDRAALHERFVDWGEKHSRERGRESEFEEIMAYHLEQAHRYLSELGPLDSHGRALGERAAERLITSGRRAIARDDISAAANLLQRAAAVLPSHHPDRLELLPTLAATLIDVGEFGAAQSYLDEAIEQAIEADDDRLMARSRLIRLHLESQSGESQDWAEQVVVEATAAISLFEVSADHESLAMAWRLLAWAHGTRCNYRDATEAAGRAVEEAGLAGDQRQSRRAASQYAVASLYGPMPVEDAVRSCEAILEEASGDRRTLGLVMSILARLRAMQGDFDGARTLYTNARLTLEEMGNSVVACSTALDSCGVEMLAGDPAAAERELRRDYEALSAMGERYLLSTLAGELARAVYAQDRYDEALEFTETARDLSADDDITSQALWRLIQGKVLARRGQTDEAMQLADEAIALLRQTDASVVRDEGLLDVAEVMRLSGDPVRAREHLAEALELFERKGNLAAADTARSALAHVGVEHAAADAKAAIE